MREEARGVACRAPTHDRDVLWEHACIFELALVRRNQINLVEARSRAQNKDLFGG